MKIKRKIWRWMICIGSFILILLLSAELQAQKTQIKITGKIVNATTGDPVINATINVKGTKDFAISDADGIFSLNAERGSRLVITSSGFRQKRS